MNGKVALVLLAAVVAVSALPKPQPAWPLFGRNPNQRIVGGQEAIPHSHPWIVDMRQGSHYCGGSIISESWVVTAAHCSTGSAANYVLVAGDHNIRTTEPEQQSRQVDRIIRHPSYGSGFQYQYDIALMHVSPPFEFNDIVKPIELPPIPGMDRDESYITVAGWGALSQGGGSPDTLYEVNVTFVTDDACRDAYGQTSISDDMLCAGETAGGKDSCQGDSGGPLTATVNGTTYLFGIVSWGRGCALEGYPGVYTEASYYKEWVASAVIPPEEDNSTFVVQDEGCGGSLVGSSGQVSYKLGEPLGANEKCAWTLRANDVTDIRVEVLELGSSGDRLYLTTLSNANGQLLSKVEITEVGVYNVTGPIVLLTLESDDNTEGNGFQLQFYGTGYSGATGLKLNNIAAGNSSGSISYPAMGDYQPDELVTIIINPEQASTLSVDRIDLESSGSCSFDLLNVHTLSNGEWGLSGTYCGTSAPAPVSSDGPILLTFMSDYSVERSGFAVSWS